MQLANKTFPLAAAPRALPCRVCGGITTAPLFNKQPAPTTRVGVKHTHGSSCTRHAQAAAPPAAAVAETAMETVTVDLGDRSYPIYIGSGILNTPEKLLAKHIKGKQVLIVTNETIAPLYLDAYVSMRVYMVGGEHQCILFNIWRCAIQVCCCNWC